MAISLIGGISRCKESPGRTTPAEFGTAHKAASQRHGEDCPRQWDSRSPQIGKSCPTKVADTGTATV